LLRANLIAESYIPPMNIRKLRELIRLRKMTVKQKVQVENRLHALLTRRGIYLPKKSLCKKSIEFLRGYEQEPSILEYLELIEFHRGRENKVLKKIEEEAVTNKDALLLMSFPGIGIVRALEIVAEIGEINRFPTAEKLASYSGLVSSVHQSGSTLYFGRLMQHSSKTLKHAFIQTAWTTIRTREGNSLNEFYKKISRKKGKQRAICATARKICCIVHAMLRNQEQYRYS